MVFPALWRYLPELLALSVLLLLQALFTLQVFRIARDASAPLRHILRIAIVLVSSWVFGALFVSVPPVAHRLPASWWLYWFRGIALGWALASSGAFVIVQLWRRVPRIGGAGVDIARRSFLKTTGGAVAAAPFAAIGLGMFVQRTDLRLKEIDLPVRGLPRELHGLRVVQLSDIHLSPFLSESELARAIDMANEAKPQLAIVTGDLITSRGDPVDKCLRQLARLRADEGILGCLGNHEIYARAEDYIATQGARLGIEFLRQRSRRLRFGEHQINIAGVDYQRKDHPYLAGAERLQAQGVPNILLSHNPDVFDTASEQGWDAILSGHTHGGQVNVEILSQSVNIARFYTPYVYGLYQKGASAIYVTRGIGTVGLPARIGAPPEVALIRLCAI